MKSKLDSLNCFTLFRAHFDPRFAKILHFQTENAGEYISKLFSSYLSSAGIMHEPGLLHSTQLVGLAERSDRTINDSIFSFHFFWADALRYYSFTINFLACQTPCGFQSPFLALGKYLVDFTCLYPFGR